MPEVATGTAEFLGHIEAEQTRRAGLVPDVTVDLVLLGPALFVRSHFFGDERGGMHPKLPGHRTPKGRDSWGTVRTSFLYLPDSIDNEVIPDANLCVCCELSAHKLRMHASFDGPAIRQPHRRRVIEGQSRHTRREIIDLGKITR